MRQDYNANRRAKWSGDPEYKARKSAIQRAYYRRLSESARRAPRARKYGLTIEVYEALLAAGCGVCGVPDSVRRLQVDHDHRCCDREGSCGNCVRGVLCRACNHGIGNFKEDPALFAAAVLYLGKKL